MSDILDTTVAGSRARCGSHRWTASHDGSFEKTEVARADLATFIVQQLQQSGGQGETITFSGQLLRRTLL